MTGVDSRSGENVKRLGIADADAAALLQDGGERKGASDEAGQAELAGGEAEVDARHALRERADQIGVVPLTRERAPPKG